MARRKAGLNPDAVAKVTSQLGEPIADLKGAASEIAGRLASGETEPITPYPGYNTTAGPAQGGSQPSPNVPSGSPATPSGPPTNPRGSRGSQQRPSRFKNEGPTKPAPTTTAPTTTTPQGGTTTTPSFTPLTGPQREQKIREEMARTGAVRRGPAEEKVDAEQEQIRLSTLPPPPVPPPPPPPGRFGQMANWMGNNPDLIPAALTMAKSVVTGRRVATGHLSPEGSALLSGNGRTQRNPIQTQNIHLYKNYPGMTQGGANQEQAANGYTKNSVNGQTGPLPQVNAPQQNNPGQVNMATTPMPAAGAGQAAPKGNQPVALHTWATVGANGNPFAADPQHAGMTAPVNPAAQPIRAPRQINP